MFPVFIKLTLPESGAPAFVNLSFVSDMRWDADRTWLYSADGEARNVVQETPEQIQAMIETERRFILLGLATEITNAMRQTP